MGKIEEAKIDKSAWGDGPWQSEPDRKEWCDEATGLPCLAVRQPSLGHWCGYVGVPEGHKLYGMDYGQCPLGEACPEYKTEGYWYCDHRPESILNAHGGITYSDKCHGGICHTPVDGEPDNVFWFGFDCAHAGDLVPSIDGMRKPGGILSGIRPAMTAEDMGETYKTLSYIEEECSSLAKQLTDINAK